MLCIHCDECGEEIPAHAENAAYGLSVRATFGVVKLTLEAAKGKRPDICRDCMLTAVAGGAEAAGRDGAAGVVPLQPRRRASGRG